MKATACSRAALPPLLIPTLSTSRACGAETNPGSFFRPEKDCSGVNSPGEEYVDANCDVSRSMLVGQL